MLTRRYYKVRTLEHVRSFVLGGPQLVTGDFELRGQRLYLLSTVADLDELAGSLDAVAGRAEQVPSPRTS